MESVEAPPKASVLIESMRDIGYSLESALADVIDNSITAGATRIHIHVDTAATDTKIAIVDNGEGMTRAELQEAMRLGSRNPRDQRKSEDLGRFGLGLKTASFSQCRRLTVVARKGGQTSAAIWDLDHVAREDKWSLQIPNDSTDVPFIDQLGAEGALVVWEHLDRAIEQGGSEAARKHFILRIDETREHLELVFHRFLEGERGLRRVEMLINGVELKPFDPFNSKNPATIHGQTERVQLAEGRVEIRSFTLPHHRNVSAADWERYAGRAGYLKNQGFYLYRQKRLILHGTWFGLARQMEITRLTRVRIDMPNNLDTAWQVDVKKASARPPIQVRERLQRIIGEIGLPSRTIYTKRGAKLYASECSIWQRVKEDNAIVYKLNPSHPVLKDFSLRLSDDLRNEFIEMISALAAALPMETIFADLAGAPESVKNATLPEPVLLRLLAMTYGDLIASGVNSEVIPGMLKCTEPFRSDWDRTEILLARTEENYRK